MHKRILWGLFFAAFILDYFRTFAEDNSKTRQKEEELTEKKVDKQKIDYSETQYNEKMKAKIDDEEVKVNYEENDNENQKINKKRKRIKQNIDLRIEFCQSWSHRGYFNQVKEYLEKTYSNISVIPSDYPLSQTRAILYYLVTFFQFSIIIAAFSGSYIKPYLIGIVPENYLDWIEGNKMMVGMGGFFIGNMLNNNITNSGAFEIYCNERLIWSAINNQKRVPNLEAIIGMVQRYGGKLYRK